MYSVTTPPENLAVSLDVLKAHLKVEHSAEDGQIGYYLQAANDAAQDRTGQVFVTQTLQVAFGGFPFGAQPVELTHGPFQSLVSLTYFDADGVEQTLAAEAVQVSKVFGGAKIYPAVGEVWPGTQPGRIEAVKVCYVAGYGTPDAVPMPIRQAIMIMATDLYDKRADVVTGTIVGRIDAAENLLSPYRVLGLG